MTGQEMIDSFLLEYDINGSGAVAGFEDDEILSFLNKAQLKVVEDVFLKFGPEQIYKANKVVNVSLLQDITEPAFWSVGLETDFMYMVNVDVLLERDTIKIMNEGWIRARRVKPENVNKFIDNDLNRLILINPVFFVRDGMIYMIKDSYTTIKDESANCKVSYVNVPVDIGLTSPTEDCKLSEKWHEDIVTLAVRMAMIVVNDARLRQAAQPPKQQA